MSQPSEGPRVLVDEPVPGVARIRLDRPRRRNAVDRSALRSLHDAFEAAAGDARVIVLGSAVPGMFCAGADLKIAADERAAVSDGLYALYRRLVTHPAVVIAALGGAAVGGGAQLAVAADLRVADDAASMRFVGPRHGLVVGTWALPSLVGRGRAVELCLTGRSLDAREAAEAGLVDRVVPDAATGAVELARSLLGADRDALTRVKALVVRGTGLLDALTAEADANRAWSGAV